MIKKLCNFPCCSNYAVDKHTYCEEHLKQSQERHQNFMNAKRANTSLYNTQRWRTLRKEHLKEQPYCVCCGSTENLTVDHIFEARGNEELFFNPDNLQTLCSTCHRYKTAQ